MAQRPRLGSRTLAETAQMILDHSTMASQQFNVLYPDWRPAWDFQNRRNQYRHKSLETIYACQETTKDLITLALGQATDRREPTELEDANYTAFLNRL